MYAIEGRGSFVEQQQWQELKGEAGFFDLGRPAEESSCACLAEKPSIGGLAGLVAKLPLAWLLQVAMTVL